MSDDPIVDVDPKVVTPERADLLAKHAIHVQGGFSDPAREKDRAESDIARGATIDWARIRDELQLAYHAKLTALSGTTVGDAGQLAPVISIGSAESAPHHPVQTPGLDDDAVPPEAMGLDLIKVRRYKELRAAQAASDAEAKALKEEADALEQQLVDEFSEAGMQSVNIDGKTIYLHHATYAQRKAGVDADGVKAALLASGHGDLISETVNSNTLSAFVRELFDEDGNPTKDWPRELDEVLELGDRYSVRVVAGRSKARR